MNGSCDRTLERSQRGLAFSNRSAPRKLGLNSLRIPRNTRVGAAILGVPHRSEDHLPRSEPAQMGICGAEPGSSARNPEFPGKGLTSGRSGNDQQTSLTPAAQSAPRDGRGREARCRDTSTKRPEQRHPDTQGQSVWPGAGGRVWGGNGGSVISNTPGSPR